MTDKPIKNHRGCQAIFMGLFLLRASSAINAAEPTEEGLLNKLLAPAPLIYDHRKLEKKDCLSCHSIRHGVPDKNCLNCHKKIGHTRKNKLSFHSRQKKSCISCHRDHLGRKYDSTLVDQKKFDHNATGFKLTGKHQENTKCRACHTKKRAGKIVRPGDPTYLIADSRCLSCHQKDDKHKFPGKLSRQDCAPCHNTSSWEKAIRFDHNKDTKYTLAGAHQKLKCAACHQKSPKKSILKPAAPIPFTWKDIGTKCQDCHQDPHDFAALTQVQTRKKNQKCQTCHNQKTWRETTFNHQNTTNFNLDGQHQKLKCQDCHIDKKKKTGRYTWPTFISRPCTSCHQDPHAQQFSAQLRQQKCTTCHDTNGWRLNSVSWKFSKPFQHNKTRFQLTGRHQQLKCLTCHVANRMQIFRFPTASKSFCIDCHQNVHTQQFSPKMGQQACTFCHDTHRFKPVDFDHQESKFKLEGAHQKVKCFNCHQPAKQFANQKNPPIESRQFLFPKLKQRQCLSCHVDYHQGQLDKNCLSCHTQQKWDKIAFSHNKQSHFPLRGLHKKVTCAKCHPPMLHKGVKFKGQWRKIARYKPLVETCISCHQDIHKGANGNHCTSCHLESGWKKLKKFHQNYNLKGVHQLLHCQECHKNPAEKLTNRSNDCFSCHNADDIHQHQLIDCDRCHTQNVWEAIAFSHSLNAFPLRGAHRALSCVTCHRLGIYASTANNCIDCHLSAAISVKTVPHSMPNFANCDECHHQFSFQL